MHVPKIVEADTDARNMLTGGMFLFMFINERSALTKVGGLT